MRILVISVISRIKLLSHIYISISYGELIKIGIIDLDSPTYNELSLLNKYQNNLNDLITSSEIDERIIKRIKIISKLKTFPESEQILKKFYANDSIYSNDLVDSIQFASRAFTEKLVLVANKQRKNDLKSQNSDALKALIPDIKINYLTRDTEILIIEQAKYKIVDNIKNSNDKFKACIEMHDMLYLVEECISKDNKYLL
ncbi:842_t:CDS:2 [Entrophospora sp. SA101]|nr:842_t:CDS:2 [Entrophospora sp. SA101]CAJ0882393.1 8889_t:CDS:2 [Entrophospora sp. SA101]CAJ0902192.1 6611_t:CDS:2 [Entrophospora sp. SA101]